MDQLWFRKGSIWSLTEMVGKERNFHHLISLLINTLDLDIMILINFDVLRKQIMSHDSCVIPITWLVEVILIHFALSNISYRVERSLWSTSEQLNEDESKWFSAHDEIVMRNFVVDQYDFRTQSHKKLSHDWFPDHTKLDQNISMDWYPFLWPY